MSNFRLSWLLVFSLLALVGVSFLASIASPADATVPGKNGELAFRRYLDTSETWGAIFVVGPDGKNERQLTRPPQGVVDDQPDWSPDGLLLVFHRSVPDRPVAIYTVKSDGSELTRLSPACSATGSDLETKCEDGEAASFLPDGKRVAYTRATGKVREFGGYGGQIEHSDIVVRDVDGGKPQVLIRSRPYAGDYLEPNFSPDGSQLVYVRANSPLAKPVGAHALFVARADGSGQRRLTPWRLNAGDHPDWSPDGKQILFRAPEDEFAGSNLYTIRPDGGGLRQLTRFGNTVEVLSASYSPDGKWIVFAKTGAKGQPDLFVMRSDGSGMRQVTRTGDWESAPDWGPRAR